MSKQNKWKVMSVVAKNLEERYAWLSEHLGQGRSCYKEYMDTFGVSGQQFYEDRKKVLAIMKDRLDDNLESWGKDLLERYELVYEMAIRRGNLKAATKVLEDIVNLKGLATQKVEVKSDNAIELNWNVGSE